MGVLHIRQHVEDAVLLPGAVRVEPGGVGFRVRHADVSPGREGFQSGEHQARAEGRPGLELVAHIEGEAAGEVGVVGVDEGALPGRRTAPGPERVKLEALAVLPPVISSTPFSTVREELYRLSIISSGFLPKTTSCSSRRTPP